MHNAPFPPLGIAKDLTIPLSLRVRKLVANVIIIALLSFHAEDDWVIAPNTTIEVQ